MKRDLDLLRDILLHIEEKDLGNRAWIKDWGNLEKVDNKVRTEHIYMLYEAGFIEVTDASVIGQNGRRFYPKRITMAGHDYLDSVRDPKIWKSTKSKLSKIGGSTTLAIIQAVAVKVAMVKLGLDT